MDIHAIYSGVEIPKMVTKRFNRSSMYFVPYNINEDNGTYTYNYVSLPPENYNYGGLVDAIIGTKYSLSNVIAIVINYIGDSTNDEYNKEFNELQEWRKFAKRESRKHFNMEL